MTSSAQNKGRPRLLGVPIDPITYDTLLDTIAQWVEAGEGVHQICTVNPEFLVVAQREGDFFTLLQTASLCVPDGFGVVWMLRLRGVDVPGRVTGSDGVPLLAERAAQSGWRLFLLGAEEGIAARAADMLRRQYPALQIVGTYAGSPSDSEAPHILALIQAAQPDILLVAYGAPAQDIWIARHAEHLPVKVAMGVGGVFDFITGNIPRAPRWLRRLGLEWLYRLYLQPSRWRRMLRLPVFVWWALRYGERPVRGVHARHA